MQTPNTEDLESFFKEDNVVLNPYIKQELFDILNEKYSNLVQSSDESKNADVDLDESLSDVLTVSFFA